MSLPIIPNPFPTLKQGLSLGAPEHRGFAAAWNWLAGIMRKAKDYFVLALNGKRGEVSIVGGEGIQVVTSGNTITINVGDGEDENDGDDGGGSGGSGSGGGSGGGGGGSGGGGTGGGGTGGGGTGGGGTGGGSGGGCNGWSDESGSENGGDLGLSNDGDDCDVLNGW